MSFDPTVKRPINMTDGLAITADQKIMTAVKYKTSFSPDKESLCGDGWAVWSSVYDCKVLLVTRGKTAQVSGFPQARHGSPDSPARYLSFEGKKRAARLITTSGATSAQLTRPIRDYC